MKNGAIILTAIALLFIGMYVYAYSFEYFQRLRANRKLKRSLKKEALLDEYKAKKDKERKEKFQKLEQRSQEIQMEIKRLEEFRNQVLNKNNGKESILKST
jgi:Flp pilus assembly protein TadB